MAFKDGLRWDRVPTARATQFYVWDDLGHGIDGRALLVSSRSGAVAVLKFFFDAQNGAANAGRECAWWHEVYPRFGRHVRVVQAAERPALLMPRLAVPDRTVGCCSLCATLSSATTMPAALFIST